MPEPTTAGRLLNLLSLLQARRAWPGVELSRRLEVSARTVRRDVERLRELGYPIDSCSGPAGGYELRSGTAMPPLLLDDEEAIAVAIGLRTAARAAVTGIEETALSALVKLEQVLPAHLRRRVQALGAATEVLAPRQQGPTVDPGCLTVLAAACRDRELARFAYRGRDGRRSRRCVEPHALVAAGRRWYLLAWDPARNGWRTFRVDRIGSPSADGGRFTPRAIPGGDATGYVTRTLARVQYRYETRVLYKAPIEELRKRVALGWGSLQAVDAHSCIYETSDDDLGWLAFRIGMAGFDFELDGPPELCEQLELLGRRFLQAAAAGSGSSRSMSA